MGQVLEGPRQVQSLLVPRRLADFLGGACPVGRCTCEAGVQERPLIDTKLRLINT